MRSGWILVCTLFFGLQGCQSAATADPATRGSPSHTMAPAPTTSGAEVASDSPTDATAGKMVSLASEHLTGRLGVTPGQVVLLAVEPVQWGDAGLGCSKPGIDYLRVPTPGYRISLQAGGATYEYHADQGNRVILCETGQP